MILTVTLYCSSFRKLNSNKTWSYELAFEWQIHVYEPSFIARFKKMITRHKDSMIDRHECQSQSSDFRSFHRAAETDVDELRRSRKKSNKLFLFRSFILYKHPCLRTSNKIWRWSQFFSQHAREIIILASRYPHDVSHRYLKSVVRKAKLAESHSFVDTVLSCIFSDSIDSRHIYHRQSIWFDISAYRLHEGVVWLINTYWFCDDSPANEVQQS